MSIVAMKNKVLAEKRVGTNPNYRNGPKQFSPYTRINRLINCCGDNFNVVKRTEQWSQSEYMTREVNDVLACDGVEFRATGVPGVNGAVGCPDKQPRRHTQGGVAPSSCNVHKDFAVVGYDEYMKKYIQKNACLQNDPKPQYNNTCRF